MLETLRNIRNIIEDNPGLPAIILAAESTEGPIDRNTPYEAYPSLGEIYDGDDAPNKNKIYTDRNELERDVRNVLSLRNEFSCLRKEEFDIAIARKMHEHEKNWKKCIIVYIKPARNRRTQDRRFDS